MQVDQTPMASLPQVQPVHTAGFVLAQQTVMASQETARAKLTSRPSFLPIYVEYKRKVPCRTFELSTQGLNVLARDALDKLPSLNGVKVIRAITKNDQLGFTFNFRIDTNELTAQSLPALLERWIEKYETAKAKAGLTPKPLPPAEPLKPRSPRRHVQVLTDSDFDNPREVEHTKVDMSVVDAAIKAHDAQAFTNILGGPAGSALEPVAPLDDPLVDPLANPLDAQMGTPIASGETLAQPNGHALSRTGAHLGGEIDAQAPLETALGADPMAQIEADIQALAQEQSEAAALFWGEPGQHHSAQLDAPPSAALAASDPSLESIPFGYVMADGSEFELAAEQALHSQQAPEGYFQDDFGTDDADFGAFDGQPDPFDVHGDGDRAPADAELGAGQPETEADALPAAASVAPDLPALRVAHLQGHESPHQWVDGDGQIWHSWISLNLSVSQDDPKKGPVITALPQCLPLQDMATSLSAVQDIHSVLDKAALAQQQSIQWAGEAIAHAQQAIVQTLKVSRTPMTRRTDILQQAIDQLPERYDALQSVLIDMQMARELARQVRNGLLGMADWATTVLQTLELSEHWHKSYLKSKTLQDACSHLSAWAQPLSTIEVVHQMGLFGDPKAMRLQKQLAKVVEHACRWANPQSTRADAARVLALWVDSVHQYECDTPQEPETATQASGVLTPSIGQATDRPSDGSANRLTTS